MWLNWQTLETAIRRRRLKKIQSFTTRYVTPFIFISLMTWLVGGFAIVVPAPPLRQDNVCEIFREQPTWYDHAASSRDRWGIPIAVQMAFVHYESSFRSHIRPPRSQLFGFIPWARPSTAYGYAQALDPTWSDYMAEAGSVFATRDQMKHALDFIGWYNRKTHDQLGIPLDKPDHLYFAYHEGRTGYRRGYHKQKPALLRIADNVAARTTAYQSQLASCESEFRCRRFYEFGPFCG